MHRITFAKYLFIFVNQKLIKTQLLIASSFSDQVHYHFNNVDVEGEI